MTRFSHLGMKVGSILKRFMRSESGMTLPLLAISMVALTSFTGIAIDVGRLQTFQSKLQFSLDAAGLAAGSTVSTANIEQEVNKYVKTNFNGYMGVTDVTTTVTANSTNTVFDLTASATMPTTFMKAAGVDSVTVTAHTQISRAVTGLELVFVLDNTGSMNDPAGGTLTKIQALKTASKTLLTTLFGGATTSTNGKLWVGVVPFSQAVNIGTSRTGWLNQYYTYDATTETYANLDWGTGSNGVGWGGCVDARLNGLDLTDDPPSQGSPSTLFGQYYWTSDNLNTAWYANGNNNWRFPTYNICRQDYKRTRYGTTQYVSGSCSTNGGWICTNLGTQTCSVGTSCSGTYNSCTPTGNYTYASPLNTTTRGPNLYCPQEVTPMTNDSTVLATAIDAMSARGNTVINQGLVWGWNMISPRWQGLWDGTMSANGLPLAYKTPGMAKAVVLLTDGMNTQSNSSHGAYWYTGSNRLNGQSLDEKTLAVCDAMKAQGIYIYTIGLGPTTDINVNLLKSCATAINYFFASPTTGELEQVFQTIGDSLSNLRVSH